MEDLRVTLVQSDLKWEDRETNLRRFSERLAGIAGRTDLIVLPEMFSTGFTMAAGKMAEGMNGPTMRWLAEQAALAGAVVTGSFIAGEDGHCYNRLIWMRPDGSYTHYDKRHLFTLAGEQHHYQAGRRRLLTELKGWKVLPLICYDLRFPVWSRNTADYDLLIYVANWPERRSHAWRSLLTARAIENQSYTIGVNRVGNDGNEVYHSGDSSLIDFAGAERYHVAHSEDVFTTILPADAQRQFRGKLRFLQDRDEFVLEGL